VDDQAITLLLAQLRQRTPPRPRSALVDQLCETYLAASPAQRQRIRRAFSEAQLYRVFHPAWWRRAGQRLRSTQEARWLRYMLVFHSIEDNRQDWRDVLLGLSDVWAAAERAGVDPYPHFQAVAALSSKTGRYDDNSMANLMGELHLTGCLEERLGRPPRRNQYGGLG
jgi:hypothetical protein